MQSSNSSDRRRAPRYACHGPIDFHIHGWYLRRGRILNLCLDGCLIDPPPGTDYVVGDHLETRFEVNRLSFRAKCVIRQKRSSGQLGIQIVCLSDRSRRQLQQLIEELSR
ncbi:PilZ domain-containing protein [Edaphobacter sp. HDX4]|uniref:PilZ domain-containing protein n=1 Tax=Edaphobacter sp. HDX4 TaxID=2794064 RepID=UPI003ABFF185